MTPLLAPQILLSLTLLVSGIAKLGQAEGTKDAMRSLRLPAVRVHGLVARALPVAEIVLALAVWVPVRSIQVVASLLVLALMVAYLVIVARALRFPEPVSCHCFGSLASPALTRATLARNLLLVLLAVIALVVAALGAAADAVLGAPLVLLGWVLALAVTVLLTVLVLGGLDAAAGEAERARGPGEGDRAGGARGRAEVDPGDRADVGGDRGDVEEPPDEILDYERTVTPFGILREADGSVATLRELTADAALLLIWLRPGCGPCERVLDRLPAWREGMGSHVGTRVLIAGGDRAADASVRERAGAVAEDVEFNLADALGGGGSPSAVLIGADGMLAGGPVVGAADVSEFVDEIVEQLESARREGLLPTA